MQTIRIMTDSASDIPPERAEELGIRVLPIPITHAGKSYSERVELNNEQFYELMLASQEIPTTAHITSETYLQEYKKIYDSGCGAVVNVTINSLGSNMFNAANLAKERFYEEYHVARDAFRIEVVDSKTYTIAYGIAVMHAAEMARQEKTVDDILFYLTDWFDRLELVFSVYSLDFVKKSGRVGCAAAFVGELLGLRPMIAFIDGVATVIDKVRGDRNVVPKLVQIAAKRSRNADRYPIGIVRGTPVKEAEELEKLIHKQFGTDRCEGIFSVGASIAINSGPKVVALVYAGEKRGK